MIAATALQLGFGVEEDKPIENTEVSDSKRSKKR